VGSPATELDPAAVRTCLTRGTMTVDGRVLPASNITLVGEVELDGVSLRCVYKPVSGERPLWDFPSGTLAAREVAAYEISELAGWHVVPVTVLTDGPFGAGMVQQWIDVEGQELVDVVPEGDVPPGWRHVLDAYDGTEQPVSLVHADVRGLRDLAVFDAVVNNADRKAGHVLVDRDGRVRGCDHGLTFHVDDKLRTVLWGWAGERLGGADREGLHRLQQELDRPAATGELCRLVSEQEVSRLRHRLRRLLNRGRFPQPPEGWRAIPWPVF
jgi:uncharacterized repeat protein (TIGR03843 family)